MPGYGVGLKSAIGFCTIINNILLNTMKNKNAQKDNSDANNSSTSIQSVLGKPLNPNNADINVENPAKRFKTVSHSTQNNISSSNPSTNTIDVVIE